MKQFYRVKSTLTLSLMMSLISPVSRADDRQTKSGTTSSSAALEIQKKIETPPFSSFDHQELVKKYRLTRLWPLNSERTLIEDVVVGPKLINRAAFVSPRTCGGETFARFSDRGVVESDESLIIDNVLNEIKPSQLQNNWNTTKKVWKKASELYPNWISAPANVNTQNSKINARTLDLYKSDINASSSMIEVIKDSQGDSFINGTDYTVGGWFKPDSDRRMNLLTKKFTGTPVDPNTGQASQLPETMEWRIFIHGNVIFFDTYRDTENNTRAKYLSQEAADEFRSQNSSVYGALDYYDDAIQHSQPSKNFPALATYVQPPKLPAQKGDVNKPVPIPPRPPVTSPPVAGPPVVVPFPPYPGSGGSWGGGGSGGGVIVGGYSGKEHTVSFDLKEFWWGATLGSCWDCHDAGGRIDSWNYLAVSAHLNDPLGPYVDLWVLRDPNPKVFGTRASFAENFKHARWELPRELSSFPVLNPVQNSRKIEAQCGSASCVRSVLQIGSQNAGDGYSGFMRGVYISKKALREEEVMNMAAQFYPKDLTAQGCTYQPKGK